VARHFHYGLVSDNGLKAFGDVSSSLPRSGDNDGLWTGVYTAALALQLAVTGDP
jgi:hypothetical protein